MKYFFNPKCVSGALALAVAMLAHPLQAAIYDLSDGPVAVDTIYGTALFMQHDQHPAGSGFLEGKVGDVFLTIHANGTEHGYNTEGDLPKGAFDVQRSKTKFDNSLQLGDLLVHDIGGTDYFGFVIDVNEANGGDKPWISLDKIQLFTNTSDSVNTTVVEDIGVKRFDLDLPEDSYVLYNDQNSGSGQADIVFYIPTAAFFDPVSIGLNIPAAQMTDYVYLYAMFGANVSADGATDGGYEEFYTLIPETSAVLPLAAMLFGVGFHASRRRRAQVIES